MHRPTMVHNHDAHKDHAHMPATIEWEPHGVLCVFSGPVMFSDILDALTTIHNHEHYDRLQYTVYDFAQAQEVSIRDGDITQLLAHTLGAAHSNPRLRTALVAQNLDHRAIGELLKARSRRPVEIFPDLAAARLWLQG